MRKNALVPHGRKREVLRPESARSLLWAERYARLKGRWLNTWITISFPPVTSTRHGKKRKWKDAYGNQRVSDSEEDLLVGVTIGYDFETESGFLFGVEAEYTDSSVGVSVTDFDVIGDRLSVNAGRDLYAGARLG